jgi:hypothetical protein
MGEPGEDPHMDRKEIEQFIWQFLQAKLKQGKESVSRSELSVLVQAEENWDNVHSEKKYFNEEICFLLSAGLLCSGDADNIENVSMGSYFITDYGKKCFTEATVFPLDQSGYIDRVKNEVKLDKITEIYLSQAVACYHKALYLASTICLGVASENLILGLIDSFANCASNREAYLGKIENAGIARRFECFKEEFGRIKGSLPKNVPHDFKLIDALFNFIRIHRNDAGHPTGKAMNREALYANFQMFPKYATDIGKLNKQFKKGKLKR